MPLPSTYIAPRKQPRNSSLDRVKVRRTFEVIVEMLKDRIYSGEYAPGNRLPAEREAAQMLGVGRPAVREAYRALELIGIVKIRKGKQGGAFITERNRQTVTETLSDLIRLRKVDMSHLTEARLILETDVAELAMRRVGAEEVARLKACIEAAIDQSRRGITATVENLQFHMMLGEMSGNPILAMMLASTLDLLQMVIGAVAPGPEVSLGNAEEHYAIIEALQSGDVGRLRPILEDHIRRSNGELMRLAKRSPMLVTPPAREIKHAKHRMPGIRAAANSALRKRKTHEKT
jgi:DNA-binding FadR family transcriptional regulator